jgi:16S rRNA (cytidine1402-2'-O)-methyltransferase
MLYLVATPIGNLDDITYRAVDILNSVDLILAEDTRRTGKLLKHYEIKNILKSYNDNNKEKKNSYVIKLLKSGKNIALVSDSGTPGISDPGFYLVRECIKNNIEISPIPGPSSVISSLICSGLPTDKFSFYGFVPKKKSKKKELFEKLKNKKETIILFESPYRLKKTILLMQESIPGKNIVIAREITKKFEEFIRGKPEEILEKIKDREIKGEIVILIGKDY